MRKCSKLGQRREGKIAIAEKPSSRKKTNALDPPAAGVGGFVTPLSAPPPPSPTSLRNSTGAGGGGFVTPLFAPPRPCSPQIHGAEPSAEQMLESINKAKCKPI